MLGLVADLDAAQGLGRGHEVENEEACRGGRSAPSTSNQQLNESTERLQAETRR